MKCSNESGETTRHKVTQRVAIQSESVMVLENEIQQVTAMLVQGPLDAISPPRIQSAGAVILFEGLVRPIENDASIAGLFYEVYEPMATTLLNDLALQTAKKFELIAVHVEHSKGFVPVYDCSFRLLVASKHRAEGLAAMDEFIIRMKQEVPIWKQVRTEQQQKDLA